MIRKKCQNLEAISASIIKLRILQTKIERSLLEIKLVGHVKNTEIRRRTWIEDIAEKISRIK